MTTTGALTHDRSSGGGRLGPEDWSEPAAIAETHISIVLFVGDRAYKLLKPVHTDFLDHSGPAERRAAAAREVDLNRQLARDVYLGLLELGTGDDREPVIVMRRLPARQRLSTRIEQGKGDDCLREVAHQIATLHAAAPRSDEIAREGAAEAIGSLWQSSARELRRLSPDLGLDRARAVQIEKLAARYLAGRRPLLEARMDAGQVCDGHGDLQAQDIFCCPDGARILDCLAFDDRLRYGDVLADIGFLAMDIERLGHPRAAERLMDWYREFSYEHHPRSLEHHYVAYRALVRAKVAGLAAAQGSVSAQADASRYVEVSEARLARAGSRLILVGGPPGVGKSTLAAALSDATGAVLLQSDGLRKDMVGVGHPARAAAPLGTGIYRPDVTSAVYDELLARAGALLGLGENVILDASWSSEGWRAHAREVATNRHADAIELSCDCAPELAEARIRQRLRDTSATSDADVGVARRMRERFEPWRLARAIDTGAPLDAAVRAAVAEVGPT